MDIPNVDKKLREARFFLDKMADQESRAFGDREPFDFYLSAFLSAARSVDYRLRHEQSAVYPAWRGAWNHSLSPADNALIRFLVDDRNVEVHESGSGRGQYREDIRLGHEYSDASGTAYYSGPPGTYATIHKPSYYFTIDGMNRKVIDACSAYFSLLASMVECFKRDNP